MKGTDQITRQMLEVHIPNRDILSIFDNLFPEGIAGYQEMLDVFVENDQWDYAELILNKIGPTEDVLELGFIDIPDRDIVFAGSVHINGSAKLNRIIAGGGIELDWDITTNWEIEAGADIKVGGNIFSARYIVAGGDIEAGMSIKAEENIEAGSNIKAGMDIKVGYCISAGGEICAGDDFEIYAGLNVRKSQKKELAIVTAKTKPKNLVSGYWVQK